MNIYCTVRMFDPRDILFLSNAQDREHFLRLLVTAIRSFTLDGKIQYLSRDSILLRTNSFLATYLPLSMY